MNKKIVFLTGTRADFGKLKSLIGILHRHPGFDVHLFVTGMHLDERYGYTVHEIEKHGFPNIYCCANHTAEQAMDSTLARTIEGFAAYLRVLKPDCIVVHGDRIEALAGATVGALNNILVAHIEGGELSGTVDELIRHAISKLSHTHFVANRDAAHRLLQMGELEESVYVIGSPDMDVVLSGELPALETVKSHYNIGFDRYAVSLFHPVTTEIHDLREHAAAYFGALHESGFNFIQVYPNNDEGSAIIMEHLQQCLQEERFRVFPSIRFESFLTLLKHAQFIIGNSSAGIREAPYYGVPTVNVGTRQHRRSNDADIIHCGYTATEILAAIAKAVITEIPVKQLFGSGNSDQLFLNILQRPEFWQISRQKQFAVRGENITAGYGPYAS